MSLWQKMRLALADALIFTLVGFGVVFLLVIAAFGLPTEFYGTDHELLGTIGVYFVISGVVFIVTLFAHLGRKEKS